jgi:intracellular septation protein A
MDHPSSDLAVHILKIYFQNDKYYKVKATLFNKINGIVYQTNNFKLYKKNISHWKRLEKAA